MKIPGFIDGLSMDKYHSPGMWPEPSLSSHGAVTLIEECPRIFHAEHFDPEFVKEPNKAFDLGNAIHILALEEHDFDDRVVVIDAENYMTKAAQTRRAEARAENRIPLLTKELVMVRAMRRSLMEHPTARLAFEGAVAERTLIWRDASTGVLCRCRPDLFPSHLRYIPDLKSAASANPRKFEKSATDLFYFQRASFYLDGVEAVFGERPKDYYWIVVGKAPPYVVTVCRADREALEAARDLNRKAREIFADCAAHGLEREHWPSYGDAAFTITMTGWKRSEVEKRREAGEFSTRSDMRAVELAEAHDSTPFA